MTPGNVDYHRLLMGGSQGDVPEILRNDGELLTGYTGSFNRRHRRTALHGEEEPTRNRSKGRRKTGRQLSAKESLKKARAFLAEYDYAAAEEELVAGVRILHRGELPLLAQTAARLLHEIGAYQRCIDMLPRRRAGRRC